MIHDEDKIQPFNDNKEFDSLEGKQINKKKVIIILVSSKKIVDTEGDSKLEEVNSILQPVSDDEDTKPKGKI